MENKNLIILALIALILVLAGIIIAMSLNSETVKNNTTNNTINISINETENQTNNTTTQTKTTKKQSTKKTQNTEREEDKITPDGWNPKEHEVSREYVGDGISRVDYDDGYHRWVDKKGNVVSYGY